MFNTPPTPISQKIGFPLIVQRPVDQQIRGPAADNPHATWLMIDPRSGFAPPEWQKDVGNVLVARADKSPLDIKTLAAITDYISDILDAFGDGPGVAQKYYNKQRQEKYMADHFEMQEDFSAF